MKRLIQNLRWSGIVVLGPTFAMCGVSAEAQAVEGSGTNLGFSILDFGLKAGRTKR
jgi:hypothetical protein